MLDTLRGFWKDERGGVLTTETIGYTLLITGAVALVGLGFAALARGKVGNIVNATTDMKAMQGNITESSGYTYTGTTDTATGIQTEATGN